MKKIIAILLCLSFVSIYATSTSTTTRAVAINGNITGQKGATNGSNGSSWENDELLAGKSSVNWYLSWDNNNLYAGREGGNNSEPALIYIQAEFTGSSYTDNSSGTLYDNTRGLFPTTGSPNWGSSGGVNFVAYIKSSYDEYRTWNGSSWSSASTDLTPAFGVHSGSHNMEVSIPWNSITQGNGKPNYIRIVFFMTNGSGGGSGSYVYGATPNSSNTPSDGNTTTATFRDWWGGYSIVGGIEPNSSSGGPLPVELTSFVGYIKKDFIELNWTTATELNNYGFEIERSSANKIWQNIGFVLGNNTSNSPKSYSFVDRQPDLGTNFYRLKQIDNDGSFKYSEQINVNFGNLLADVFKLRQNYPNPFNPKTKISFFVGEKSNVEIKIFNVLGIELMKLVDELKEPGNYSIDFDGSSLPSGVYYYQMKAGKFTDTKKMIINK